jgi:DNA-binding winged helix-turn-helix (wHTH) protein
MRDVTSARDRPLSGRLIFSLRFLRFFNRFSVVAFDTDRYLCECDPKLLYWFDKCAIDTGRRELRRDAELIPLEPKVFDLLLYLIEHRAHVVSRDDLIASIWDGRVVSESAVSTRINAARSAIGDSGEEQRFIKTLPRKGVRFVADVREERDPTHPVAADAGGKALNPLPLPDHPSIAVLPFIDMSGDSEQDYFADGMAEEITTALSRCAWLGAAIWMDCVVRECLSRRRFRLGGHGGAGHCPLRGVGRDHDKPPEAVGHER